MRRLAGLLIVSIAVLALATPAGATTPGRGAPGAGDPFFPYQGNGGYDVASYDLAITYNPATHALSGHAHITATTTQALSVFDLDLRHSLTASAVLVNGVAAAHRQPADRDQELVITPATSLANGAAFTVDVTYAGTGQNVTDPDGSPDGWIPTTDGAFVASEPQGSPTWFPVNDTPDDKATYTVAITVSNGITAMSNGVLVSSTTVGPQTTWTWNLDVPVSSYLITATLGQFTVTTGATKAGVPFVEAVDPALVASAANVLKRLPNMIDYFSSVYGAFPFPSTGAIIDDAPQVGYELETATRPVFDRVPDPATLAHELAHQWFGDDVTLARWRDIWLNEGFAEFSAWLWTEHTGGATAAQKLANVEALPATNSVWNPPPANPGSSDQIFSNSVYERGAGALEALREKLGDTTFFAIMQGWVQAHAQGNATVAQFETFAESVSGKNLGPFFYNWLSRPGKPNV